MGASVPYLVRDQHGSYTSPDDPGEPNIDRPRVSITEEEGKILSGLAAGRRVAEIGTGLGVSTCALARFADVVHTHDIDPWVHESVWPTLPANVVTHVERKSIEDFPIDLVFIDADHSTAAVLADIEWTRWRIQPVLIVLHDSKYDNVARALLTDKGDWTTFDTHHGLAFGR